MSMRPRQYVTLQAARHTIEPGPGRRPKAAGATHLPVVVQVPATAIRQRAKSKPTGAGRAQLPSSVCLQKAAAL